MDFEFSRLGARVQRTLPETALREAEPWLEGQGQPGYAMEFKARADAIAERTENEDD